MKEDLFFSKLTKLKKISINYFNNHLEKFGLTSLSAKYLFVLENEKKATPSKLSEVLEIDKANTTRTIIKLLKLNYITKTKDKDNRKYYVELTDEGKKITNLLLEKFQSAHASFLYDIPLEEEIYITNILNKIIDNAFAYFESKK